MAKKDPYEVNHDFGFSFDDSTDDIRENLDSTKEKLALAQSALYTMREMITPLLDNLMKEPDKPTIKWPNRAKKVQEFKNKLDNFIEQEISKLQ